MLNIPSLVQATYPTGTVAGARSSVIYVTSAITDHISVQAIALYFANA
jgi:hypothetical protein